MRNKNETPEGEMFGLGVGRACESLELDMRRLKEEKRGLLSFQYPCHLHGSIGSVAWDQNSADVMKIQGVLCCAFLNSIRLLLFVVIHLILSLVPLFM